MKQPKTLGERVFALREHYRLNQYEFGARLGGVSHVAIGNIERGDTKTPQKRTLQSIVDEFGTTMDWLLEGKGEMIPGGSAEFERKSKDIYQDALYKELKQDKETWKEKYEQVFKMLSNIMEKGNLGKFKATVIAARKFKKDRVPVVREFR